MLILCILNASDRKLVSSIWLSKINNNLPNIVKLELSDKFKAGVQMCTLIDDILDNLELWLRKYSGAKADKDNSFRNFKSRAFYQKNSTFPRGTSQSQFRGGYKPPNQPQPQGQQFQPQQKYCPACFYLGKELKIIVEGAHFPSQCLRKEHNIMWLKAKQQKLESSQAFSAESNTEETDSKDLIDQL